MRRRVITVLALVLVSGIISASALAGPVSTYYLSNGQQLYAAQGSSKLWTTATAHPDELAIAVDTSIRTIGSTIPNTSGAGRKYTLGGANIGPDYAHPAGIGFVYDGASDGQHNYTVDLGTGNVFRLDPDWANPQLLFTAPGGSEAWLGITYDPTNDSLWLSGWNSTHVYNYSMGGVFLGGFEAAHTSLAALARDPADGTLWLANAMVWGSFEQYHLGQLVDTQSYPGMINVLGGEFAVSVPEPNTMVLAGLAASGLAVASRRRCRRCNR